MRTKAKINPKRAYMLFVAIVMVAIVLSVRYSKIVLGATGKFEQIITTSASPQTKNGNLAIDGKLTAGKLCLGNTCITDFGQLKGPAGYAPGSEEITTPGWYSVCIGSATPSGVNCSYHTSDGTTMLHAEIWGGGGGGAVGRATFNWNYSIRSVTGGGAGGSGAWTYADIPVKNNDVIWVYVGSGGAGESNAYRNNQDDYSYGGLNGEASFINGKNGNRLLTAGGGAAGYDVDWIWTSGNKAGMNDCVGVTYPGGTASSAIQALTQNGNLGAACDPHNTDNRPGGAAIKSPKSGKQYGAGANGRYWGTDPVPQWSCTTSITSYASGGEATSYSCYGDTIGTPTTSISGYDISSATPNDDGTCTAVNCSLTTPLPGIVPPAADNGQNGAAYITW